MTTSTTLNQLIGPDKKTVSWLHQNFVDETIFIDNSFQRRSAWVQKNKARLIETILTGFPMPEIYLWAENVDSSSGKIRYSVVDGQQRLTAIKEFISDGFSIRKSDVDERHSELDFVNKKFSELADDRKNSIWNYEINTRTIPNSVVKKTIIAMFLRLNETDMSLNPQELRHAEFDGKFIRNVEKVAAFDFWRQWEFFSLADVRRMRDIQFVSSLLVFLRSGIEAEITQQALNDVYDLYNDVYSESKKDRETVEAVLKVCDRLFRKDEAISEFFIRQVHFYPLFVAIYSAQATKTKILSDKVAPKMLGFIRGYDNPKSALIARYKVAATEGTQKRTNRAIRARTLAKYLGLG